MRLRGTEDEHLRSLQRVREKILTFKEQAEGRDVVLRFCSGHVMVTNLQAWGDHTKGAEAQGCAAPLVSVL